MKLTLREKQVLTLVCGGESNRYIAEKLGIKPDTVKKHIGHIMDKTGLSTRMDLALAQHAKPESEKLQELKSQTVARLREIIVELES
jgi:DNA-binding NarL/FixJ family response regulator